MSDIIEDIYSFNYSEKLEQQKNERVSQTIDRLTSRINQITNDDKKIVNELFGEFIIEPFGSSVNGFYMHGKNELSDLDISINFYYNPAVNKEKVLQTILPAIDGVSKGEFILIFESKVPLIKYTDSVTKEEWDLWVNGILGVMNSKLIKTYASIDTILYILIKTKSFTICIRYHKMGYFFKILVKALEINRSW